MMLIEFLPSYLKSSRLLTIIKNSYLQKKDNNRQKCAINKLFKNRNSGLDRLLPQACIHM